MKKTATLPGFTLVELIVVIGIVAVIITALLYTLNPLEQLRKSADTKRKNDLAQIQRALELYYQDNGSYPTSSADFKIINNLTTLAWGSAWQPYIAALPKDPAASKTYVYYSPASANGQTYYLYASLERGSKDAQACNNGNACTSITTGGAGFPAATSCGTTCSYGISSPNVSP
jgi:general secretion pathway protein G